MDYLTFISEVIKAVAWPATVLLIFLLLRRPISELIPLLQRLRYRNLELDFGRQIQALAIQVNQALPPEAGILPADKEFLDHLVELAQLSPRAVILESWLRLEKAAIQASKRHHLDLTSRQVRSPLMLGQALTEAGILDESKQEIFYRLRNLRNAAAHASDFSFDPDSAMEYASAAVRLANFIQQA